MDAQTAPMFNHLPAPYQYKKRVSPATLPFQSLRCFRGTLLNTGAVFISFTSKFSWKNHICETTGRIPAEVRDKEENIRETTEVEAIQDSINYIKNLLTTMDDGRISVSPYDTAWVALIKNPHDHNTPQFPTSLEWIVQNQLPDGSWGDMQFFCPYDRIVNTLACIVVLKLWNIHSDMIEKGVSFMKQNVSKLENANPEHMSCGFETVVPALLEKARELGIDGIPYGASVIREIYAARDRKWKRVPRDLMHKVPTSLLFSLEGLPNLDWEKLLKLQSSDGSFLTSPSSTAFAFMQTQDKKCFEFIKNTLEKCNGGAPHTYPVDIFARLWAVDRLQRLGISRFFESEIIDILSYIYRYWTDKGFFSAKESEFVDLDDTSMGFRLLRLQGYDVNPNVLRHFKTGDKFSCYGGQIIESPSPIYNLYRASQVLFPGEQILEEAKTFSYQFLKEKVKKNDLLDKWVISKGLPDEIRLGLSIPWYATLPRILTKFYLEHYGGANDVWIGKALYRMPEISNEEYHKLAKLDFMRCQAQHQNEWNDMQEWYETCNIQVFGISKNDLLLAFFLATATIFEPERSRERNAWAKSQIIWKMVTSYFDKETTSTEKKFTTLTKFKSNMNSTIRPNSDEKEQGLLTILADCLREFLDRFDRHSRTQLKNTWLMKLEETVVMANWGEEAELLATTLNICGGHIVSLEEIKSHHEYKTLSHLATKICRQLSEYRNKKILDEDHLTTTKTGIKYKDIDQDMQALVKLVLEETCIKRSIKQAFLAVVKTFYYIAYCAAEDIDMHMYKVLFEPITV